MALPGWPTNTNLLMIPARGPHTKLKCNPDRQAIGSWARYLGLGTQAEADPEPKSGVTGYWQLWAGYPGLGTQAEADPEPKS